MKTFMAKSKNSLIAAFDGLPKIVKIILALPFLDVVWAVYRLVRSIAHNNTLGIVLGILMLFFCAALFWVVDLITIIVWNKVVWID